LSLSAQPIVHTILVVIGLSIGNVLLKIAATSSLDRGQGILGLINVYSLAGLMVYGLATIAWMWILRTVPLGYVYPLISLTFILVPLASWWLLDEPYSYKMLLGGILIISGVAISR
jgi:drug/metabolite transporter (DMT)-like permease